MKILAINPGSTSTKIGVFDDEALVMHHTIRHTIEELSHFDGIMQQFEYRRDLVLKTLEETGVPFDFDVIIGRGGLVRPISAGVYVINDKLLIETEHPLYQHACNLGAIITHNLANRLHNCRALIADPGVVDELDDVARITGLPEIPRTTVWHALNQRAIAHRYATEHNTKYEQSNIIIAHMGGGISVAAHHNGRAVDVNNALIGEGPFSPERSGTLPFGALIDLCYSGRYTRDELIRIVTSQSGLLAHLGTNEIPEILKRIEQGDERSRLILDAMIYQISKAIGALTPVLYGNVDAILLTGGIAYSDYITNKITERVRFIAPVYVYPGEDELTALALNAYLAMRGEIEIKEY